MVVMVAMRNACWSEAMGLKIPMRNVSTGTGFPGTGAMATAEMNPYSPRFVGSNRQEDELYE